MLKLNFFVDVVDAIVALIMKSQVVAVLALFRVILLTDYRCEYDVELVGVETIGIGGTFYQSNISKESRGIKISAQTVLDHGLI